MLHHITELNITYPNTPLETAFPTMAGAKKNVLPAVKVHELNSEDLTKRELKS